VVRGLLYDAENTMDMNKSKESQMLFSHNGGAVHIGTQESKDSPVHGSKEIKRPDHAYSIDMTRQ
jgi:hypothetical protein